MEPIDEFNRNIQDSISAYSILLSGKAKDYRQVNTILSGSFEGFLTAGLKAWKKEMVGPVELFSDALVVAEKAAAVYENERYSWTKFEFSEAEMLAIVLGGQLPTLFAAMRPTSHDFTASIPGVSPGSFWLSYARTCLVGGLFTQFSRLDWESLRSQEHRGFRGYKKLYDLYWDGVEAIHTQDRKRCAEGLRTMVVKVRSVVAGMDEERYGDIWDYPKKVDLKIAAIATVADKKFNGIGEELGLGYDLFYKGEWTNKSDLTERALTLYPPRAKSWWRFW